MQICIHPLSIEDGPDVEASAASFSIFRDTAGSWLPADDLNLVLMRNRASLLTSFLHVSRLPAFTLYQRFTPARIQPVQVCVLVLRHLEQNPATDESQQLNYLLDEEFLRYTCIQMEMTKCPPAEVLGAASAANNSTWNWRHDMAMPHGQSKRPMFLRLESARQQECVICFDVSGTRA